MALKKVKSLPLAPLQSPNLNHKKTLSDDTMTLNGTVPQLLKLKSLKLKRKRIVYLICTLFLFL